MLTAQIIFWLSALAILYAYVGYPVTLWLVSFFIKAVVEEGDVTPPVSLVISAFNEEAILANKLENALNLDYPRHLLEIAVISDGSTDGTNDILLHFAREFDTFLPTISAQRKGKTACLNEVVPKQKGEIILFSDANSFYNKDLIRNIVRPFRDPAVGLVTGTTRYVTGSESAQAKAAGLYSRLEALIKLLETRTGSCVGADGAVFSIRKSLFSTLQEDDINDLVIPFHVVSKGYRCILEPSVFCTEEAIASRSEFQRQIRITTRTLRAIFRHRYLLNPFRYPFYSYKLFSHKVMRFLVPFFLVALGVMTIFLGLEDGRFYKIAMLLQGILYVSALIGLFGSTKEKKPMLIEACHAFVAMNVAYAVGWFKYLTKESYTAWKPQR